MKTYLKTKTYFEITQKLGEGLTSEVYGAFRKDDRGFSRQKVALKIIKSKNDVRFLQQEFEKLKNLGSKRCVQLLGWENLPQGPALILEYIDGVTLHDLDHCSLLNPGSIKEIMRQVKEGLNDLHSNGLVHGDINLKNIMVTRRGQVKLIDLGFFKEKGDFLVSPQFASPEILAGAAPSSHSDFYSMEQVRKSLSAKLGDNPFAEGLTLMEAVKSCIEMKKCPTVFVSRQSKSSMKTKQMAVGFLLFLCLMILPERGCFLGQFSKFRFSSRRWASLSINGLPSQYGPLSFSSLRAGTYRMEWRQRRSTGSKRIRLTPRETFLLQPDFKKL